MKKIYFVLIFLSATRMGFSQTEKGSVLLGGNLYFTSTSSSQSGMYGGHSSATEFALNPMIGIFPANNFAVILNTSYGSYSSSFSTSSLLIGPLVRYYIPASQSVKFFGGAGIEWASGDGETHTVYRFQAGPSFFINRNLALEFNFSYQWTTINSSYENISSTEKQSQFGTSVGFMVYLGKGKSK